jgi:transcriptional regulator with XRE-family HTH domain
MSSMKDTPIRNPEQLGRAIRLKRLEKGLSQVALAGQVGVERKWVIHLEAGNPKAELGLILKVLEVLELQTSLNEGRRSSAQDSSHVPSRLDEVFLHLQRRPNK